ncbi:hypothetical protein QUA70_03730 [Microcoleus sp. LAD1_D5]|uniref:hypothetical protein n=1 Tax=unclassified Microcoleus TaxID=2642155 RepID=UPI002FD4333F
MAVAAFEGELKEEGSSATDSVTDVTDVTDFRKKEEGRGKKEEEKRTPISNYQFPIPN